MGVLQLYVYGNNESGFLDVDRQTVLTLQKTMNEFDEDFAIGEISLPCDIAWTEKNRRLLDFSERVANNNTEMPYWRCDVYDDGFPELVNAKLTILTKAGNWDYSSGKFSCSISGQQGLFGTAIRNRKMRDLAYGGNIVWDDMSSRQFATAVTKGTAGAQWPYLKFVPVAIQDFYDTGAKTYIDEFLAQDTVNNVVEYTNGDWSFDRRDPDHANAAIPQDNSQYNDYLTIPFFSLQFILTQIFTENGFAVSGDIFGQDFKDIVVFNNYGIERYYANNYRDFNRSINPKNHVPDIAIIDWLKATFNFFNLYVTFNGVQAAQINFRQNNISKRNIFSINGLVINNSYQSTISNQDQDGYKLAYNWDSNDSYPGDWNKDMSDKNIIAEVNSTTQLAGVNIGRQLTLNDAVLVREENLYYIPADATVTPIVWQPYSNNLPDYTQGNGDRNIDLGASTLCQYIKEDDSGPNIRLPYLACAQKGSYTNKNGDRITNDFGVRFFYAVYRLNRQANKRPYSLNHRTSSDFFDAEKYSLAMGVNYGLDSLHTRWQNFLNGKEVFKCTVRVDKRTQDAIENATQLELQNVLFVTTEIDKKIPMDGLLDIQMRAI